MLHYKTFSSWFTGLSAFVLLAFLSFTALEAEEDSRSGAVEIGQELYTKSPIPLPRGFTWVPAGGGDSTGSVRGARQVPSDYSFLIASNILHGGEFSGALVSAEFKLMVDEGSKVEIFIQHNDRNSGYLSTSGLRALKGTDGQWKTVTVSGEVPEACRHIQFGVRVARGFTGSFELDEVKVYYYPSAIEQTTSGFTKTEPYGSTWKDGETYMPRYAGKPITIDGTLDDTAWKEAEWQAEFTVLSRETKSSAQTAFALAYDTDFLYLAVRCEEPSAQIVSEARIRGEDEIWSIDDFVQFFLAPGGQRLEYFFFSVNASGSIAEGKGLQSGTVQDVSWISRAKSATQKTEKAWTLELAIPWADIEIPPGFESPWGFNVVRKRTKTEFGRSEHSTFVPLDFNFHQPASFARVSFNSNIFESRLYEFQSIDLGRLKMKSGQIILPIDIVLRNFDTRPRIAKVRTSLSGAIEHEIGSFSDLQVVLDSGQVVKRDVAIKVRESGSELLTVEVFDPSNPKRILARNIQRVDQEFRPFQLQLKEPSYKQSIFPTQNLEAIEGYVEFAIEQSQLKDASAHFTLTCRDSSEVIAEADLEDWNDPRFRLAVPNLAVGAYDLRVEITGPQLSLGYDETLVIRKLAPSPSGIEWRIDRLGNLLRNGVPFLPVGWYSINNLQLVEAGSVYTIVLSYAAQFRDLSVLREYLDGVAAAGAYAIIYPTEEGARPETILREPLDEATRKQLRKRVTALMDHPALLAWYIADEPEFNRITASRVSELHELISEIDPYHPTILVNNTIRGIPRFAHCADILAPNPFPYFIENGNARPNALQNVTQFIKVARSEASTNQAVWVVPQAHDTTDFGGISERAPTFRESRNMVWQAIAADARGILWWAYSRVYPNLDDSVSGNAYLAEEVQSMEQFIHSPAEKLPEFELKEGAGPVFVAHRSFNDQQALIVVNAAYENSAVTVHALETVAKTLYNLGTTEEYNVDDEGNLELDLSPLEVLILTTNEGVFPPDALATIERQLLDKRQSRFRNGNLALRQHGAKLMTASKKSKASPGSHWMQDGVRNGIGWTSAPFKGEEAIDIRFEGIETVSKILMFTDSVSAFRIDSIEDEGVKRIGEWDSLNGNPIELVFSPVATSHIRLTVTGLRDSKSAVSISELEVYSDG